MKFQFWNELRMAVEWHHEPERQGSRGSASFRAIAWIVSAIDNPRRLSRLGAWL
jgi:hypothetical protein